MADVHCTVWTNVLATPIGIPLVPLSLPGEVDLDSDESRTHPAHPDKVKLMIPGDHDKD